MKVLLSVYQISGTVVANRDSSEFNECIFKLKEMFPALLRVALPLSAGSLRTITQQTKKPEKKKKKKK